MKYTYDREGTAPDRRMLEVGDGIVADRLDKILAMLCPDMSRTRLKDLILEGAVLLDGEVCEDPSQRVEAGSSLELNIPEVRPTHIVAENIPLDIVYEDGELLVINKQPGLTVHPGAGQHSGTLVNALLHHCAGTLSGIGGVERPGIVHRLDKDTSGLMVVAKTDITHRSLAEQLSARTLSRIYHAIVLGVPVPPAGLIDMPLGRHPTNRQKMAIRRRDGRDARTNYRVLKNFGAQAAALVECKLDTGRTHQIRVHMESIGNPLLGDPTYGAQDNAVRSRLRKGGYGEDALNAVSALTRQMLHARKIAFEHPGTGEEMEFESELPPDMQGLVSLLEAKA